MTITIQQAVDRLYQELGRLTMESARTENQLEELNGQPDVEQEDIAKITKRSESYNRRATQLREGIDLVEKSTSWVRGKERIV
jgi:chromosome segregation ATPase